MRLIQALPQAGLYIGVGHFESSHARARVGIIGRHFGVDPRFPTRRPDPNSV